MPRSFTPSSVYPDVEAIGCFATDDEALGLPPLSLVELIDRLLLAAITRTALVALQVLREASLPANTVLNAPAVL